MEDDDDNFRDRRQPEGWHLDKRIPIATLVAILTLAVGGILIKEFEGAAKKGRK